MVDDSSDRTEQSSVKRLKFSAPDLPRGGLRSVNVRLGDLEVESQEGALVHHMKGRTDGAGCAPCSRPNVATIPSPGSSRDEETWVHTHSQTSETGVTSKPSEANLYRHQSCFLYTIDWEGRARRENMCCCSVARERHNVYQVFVPY